MLYPLIALMNLFCAILFFNSYLDTHQPGDFIITLLWIISTILNILAWILWKGEHKS